MTMLEGQTRQLQKRENLQPERIVVFEAEQLRIRVERDHRRLRASPCKDAPTSLQFPIGFASSRPAARRLGHAPPYMKNTMPTPPHAIGFTLDPLDRVS